MVRKKGLRVLLLSLVIILSLSLIAIFVPNGGIIADTEDVEPPTLVDLEFTSLTFNTEWNEDTVEATITVTDNLSGFEWGYIRLVPISGHDLYADIYFYPEHLVSGDLNDGVYTSETSFHQYIANGEWKIEDLSLTDHVGNSVNFSEGDLEAILDVTPGDLRLTNTATIEDVTPPELLSFEIPEGYDVFDTEEEDQEVKLLVTVSDDVSGIPEMGGVAARIMPEDQEFYAQERDIFFEVVGTSGEEITYEGTGTIPKGAKSGTWQILFFNLTDNAGNTVGYTLEDLESEYGTANVYFTNNASSEDLEAPIITDFSITPNQFDTSVGDVELTITLEIEDNFSGIKVDEDGISHYIGASITPLISTQSSGFANLERQEGGDDYSAVYVGTLTLPQYSKSGIWEVSLGATDKVGNRMNCEGARIGDSCDATQLFPDSDSSLLVNTSIDDSVLIERDWTITSPTMTIIFPEGTEITKNEGGSFAFYRMVAIAYDIEDADSFDEITTIIENQEASATGLFETIHECNLEEGCVETEMTEEGFEGDPIAILRAGIPGLNIDFSIPVNVTIHNLNQFERYELQIQTFQEGGESWANEDSCTVMYGDCSFTVSHASFFGASVLSAFEMIDRNNDGIPDDEQPYVQVVTSSVNDDYVVLEAPEGTMVMEFGVNPLSFYNIIDNAFSYNAGFVNFEIMYPFISDPEFPSEPASIPVKLFFYGDYDASLAVARKLNTNTNEIFTITEAEITNETIGGENVLIISYEILDGGPLDMDGEANGVIIDPVAMGINTAGVPRTGLGGHQSRFQFIKNLLGIKGF